MEHSEDTIDYATVIIYAFKKYCRKSGIKELDKKGETAVTEDLSQLQIRDTLLPESDKHLTKEQKRDALKSLMFLKVKRDRRVKRQTCVDFREKHKKMCPETQLHP